jgi:uroporphyrinogen decarboxylase
LDEGKTDLNSRERVLTALAHEEPDRVPFDLGGWSSTIERIPYDRLKQYLGINSPTNTFCRDHSILEDEILEKLGVDTRYLHLDTKESGVIKGKIGQTTGDNSYVDEWGVRWAKPETSYYWDMIEHPLRSASAEDLERYEWPEPNEFGPLEGIEDQARVLFEETDKAIVAEPFGAIFEQSMYMRSFAGFLADLHVNPDFATRLMQKVTQTLLPHIEEFVSRVGDYVQIVDIGDDLGMQDRPLISPQIYRKLVKPFHKRVVDTIKAKTDARVFFHTDGSVFQLIPDLIDVGIDILSPVQPLARDMESDRLKKMFGEQLAFHGGIDIQRVLPNGTPEEVGQEVKTRISAFGAGGGYIAAPAHNIQPDVPPENMVALCKAVRRYGEYPIDG